MFLMLNYTVEALGEIQFKANLFDRSQCVKVEGTTSDVLPVVFFRCTTRKHFGPSNVSSLCMICL